MTRRILGFGPFRDLIPKAGIILEAENELTIGDLRKKLEVLFATFDEASRLNAILRCSAIASSTEILFDDRLLGEELELALVPPVSGG